MNQAHLTVSCNFRTSSKYACCIVKMCRSCTPVLNVCCAVSTCTVNISSLIFASFCRKFIPETMYQISSESHEFDRIYYKKPFGLFFSRNSVQTSPALSLKAFTVEINVYWMRERGCFQFRSITRLKKRVEGVLPAYLWSDRNRNRSCRFWLQFADRTFRGVVIVTTFASL